MSNFPAALPLAVPNSGTKTIDGDTTFTGVSTFTGGIAIPTPYAQNLVAATTATYDIGLTGTRWRRAYLSAGVTITTAGTLVAGSNTLVGGVADKLNAAHLAIASQAIGDILFADSSTSFARLVDVATGQVLKSGGVGVAPAWGAIGGVTGATTPAFTGTPGVRAETLAFVGTGFATAGQVVTTTDSQTMALNECANMWLITATQAPCLIVSNTAVAGAPAVLTVYGLAPTTAAEGYKILTSPAPAGSVASHTHSGTGLT